MLAALVHIFAQFVPYTMSDNSVTDGNEQQEQNENMEADKESGDEKPAGQSHSRKKRSIIDAPYKSNTDASGNAAEEF